MKKHRRLAPKAQAEKLVAEAGRSDRVGRIELLDGLGSLSHEPRCELGVETPEHGLDQPVVARGVGWWRQLGKSFFTAPPGKGLPIGNHTSQFFANVYLNELDQFVKHRLRAPYYIRYLDDLVLLSPSREELERWREEIGRFLNEHLLLELNERRSRIAPLSSGIDFLGYVTHPRHRLVRRRVVANLKERLAAHEKEGTVEAGGYHWVLYREGASEHLEAMLASYRAILLCDDTWRLRPSLEARFPWLERLYPLPSAKSFWRGARSFPCLAAQAHAFRERFPDSLVLIEVGRFLEVHGHWAETLGRLLRLKVYRGRRGGACRWTRFPVERMSWLLDRAFASGVEKIVLVGEKDEGLGRILARRAGACGARADTGKTSADFKVAADLLPFLKNRGAQEA